MLLASSTVLGAEYSTWLVIAGLGQLLLVGGSLAIPRVLGWREQLTGLPTLTRQVFWTYAAYIVISHMAFALVSVFASAWLLDGSVLARCVAGFIAVWWGVRLLLGLFVFDAESMPDLPMVHVADRILLVAFAALTTLYSLIAAGVSSAGAP